MLNKRLKILQVYEKGLQNCFDFKNRGNIFRVSRDTPRKPAKRSYVYFHENCICGDKNISDLDYGGDNLSHPFTRVFGKILDKSIDFNYSGTQISPFFFKDVEALCPHSHSPFLVISQDSFVILT